MYIVKYAKRGSEDYNQTLQIRNEVFFKPLGKDISQTDLSCEDGQIVIGAFETNSIYTNLIIGTAVISCVDETTFKVEWLCADPILRKKGIGTSLMQIGRATARRMELAPEKVMINIQRYGNTTSATIPICLCEWEKQLRKGDNIIISAFGAGFTWGALYLKWAYNS